MILSKLFLVSVTKKLDQLTCAGNRLYIRVRDEKGYNQCRKDEYDNDEEVIYFTTYYADNLYCMDIDGKKEKKLWEGGYNFC